MLKKLTLLGMSVAALLAFAPAAQATGPLITNSLGEAAKTISATSSNTHTQTANGRLECLTVSLHGNLTTNANTTAHGSGTGSAIGNPDTKKHTDPCKVGGLLVDITNVTLSTLHLTRHSGETTGTANFTYTYDITSSTGSLIAECTFSGTNVPVKRTGGNVINVKGPLVRTGGTAFCPATGEITGDFSVFDEFGAPAVIH